MRPCRLAITVAVITDIGFMGNIAQYVIAQGLRAVKFVADIEVAGHMAGSEAVVLEALANIAYEVVAQCDIVIKKGHAPYK